MAAFSLPLKKNVLHPQPQTLEFEKIATFIGGNGSGKSTILKSIFDEKLKGSIYQDYKIVCFSSGQNESYSSGFSAYLNTERSKRNALSLDCFYYDKMWSKLLIFLSTTSKPNGLVRTFLKQHSYVAESDLDGDETTRLQINVKIDKSYVNLVTQAREDEENGQTDLIINRAYHLTLANFINKLIDSKYEFNAQLEQRSIELTQEVLSGVSFETDVRSTFDSKVMFFTQAADNDYFIVKESFNLIFKNGDRDLHLEDLSDGEYQLLFIYSLFDLFDTENTLFLLDEADSHLHYKNVERLWSVFDLAKGGVITTTHLIDSIAKSGIERLKVIEKGQVNSGSDLKNLSANLRDLSAINDFKFHALSLFPNVVLIDNESDWLLFKLLVLRKLADVVEDERAILQNLSKFIAIMCNSGHDGIIGNVRFADAKLKWQSNFDDYLCGHPHNTRNIFLICDRDELAIQNVGTDKCKLFVKNYVDTTKTANLSSHLLSWRRREIKHYLLSFTALAEGIDNIEAELNLGPRSRLLANNSGDKTTNGAFNETLACVNSAVVKRIVSPYINIDGHGFSEEKAKEYIGQIPKAEISEDIVDMYYYLIGVQ